MTNFKNHPNKHGFSLIEVMIALTVFAVIMTTLFTLQATLLSTASKAWKKVENIIIMKNYLYEMEQKNIHAQEKLMSDEKKTEYAVITFSEQSLSKNSVFKKIKRLMLEQIIMRTSQGTLSRLIFIRYVPKIPEEKT